MDAVVAVDERRHGEHRRLIAHYGLDDAGEGGRNRKVGGALAADDLVGGIAHTRGDGRHVLAGTGHAGQPAVLVKRHVRKARRRPGDKLAVAVLAEHVRMDVARIDAVVRRKLRPQARRIEDRAGAEHLCRRQARQAQCGERERIDRIGSDEEQPFGIRAHHFAHNAAQHLHVAHQQRRPALALALRGARSDHGHRRARRIGQPARPHADRGVEGDGVRDVHRLALRALVVGVDHHDLAGHARGGKRIGERAADPAGAHHCDLRSVSRHPSRSPPGTRSRSALSMRISISSVISSCRRRLQRARRRAVSPSSLWIAASMWRRRFSFSAASAP